MTEKPGLVLESGVARGWAHIGALQGLADVLWASPISLDRTDEFVEKGRQALLAQREQIKMLPNA